MVPGYCSGCALDGTSSGVARTDELVVRAVEEDVRTLGVTRHRVTALVNRCTMASMMPGETGIS